MSLLIFPTEPFWCWEQDKSGWNQQKRITVTTGKARKSWCVQGSIALSVAIDILTTLQLGSQARSPGQAALFL